MLLTTTRRKGIFQLFNTRKKIIETVKRSLHLCRGVAKPPLASYSLTWKGWKRTQTYFDMFAELSLVTDSIGSSLTQGFCILLIVSSFQNSGSKGLLDSRNFFFFNHLQTLVIGPTRTHYLISQFKLLLLCRVQENLYAFFRWGLFILVIPLLLIEKQ